MKNIDRRSALALGLAAASATIVEPAAAQSPDALAGKDTTPWPGVVVRAYGESPSLIPGFKTVSMRDMIIQPGSKGNPAGDPMMNAMVCHMPYPRRGAAPRAGWKELHGQEKLRLDLQQGHERDGLQ